MEGVKTDGARAQGMSGASVAASNVGKVITTNEGSARAGRTVVDFEGSSCLLLSTQMCSFYLDTTCLVCGALINMRWSMI